MATYADAGVDIEAGNEAVRQIAELVSTTHKHFQGDVLGGIGGFSGLVQYNGQKAVLGAATDGVGSKLLIALLLEKYDGIGIDLVAMCVNDLIAGGHTPSFFLDYIAMGRQVPERTKKIVEGIVLGCHDSEMALIGGEMAEVPGLYAPDHFDLAGFAVGRVSSRRKLLLPSRISHWSNQLKRREKNLAVYGAPSNGLHSNGFSLVRDIFDIDLRRPAGSIHRLGQYKRQLGHTLGDELLRPTYIYHRLIKELRRKHRIVGLVHITGGGLNDNPPRIMPKGCAVRINLGSWEIPPIFHLISKKGKVGLWEMIKVFNCGIGMLIISPDDIDNKDLIKVGEVVRCDEAKHSSSATLFKGGQGLFVV